MIPRKAGALRANRLRAVSAAGRFGKVMRKEVVRDRSEVRGASIGWGSAVTEGGTGGEFCQCGQEEGIYDGGDVG